MILTENKSPRNELINSNEKILWRLTALWGFSEAALGGLLHGFKIPFTGMFVGGAAIIFITLLAYYSDKRGKILRATIIVIIIKGIVSPHSPVTAYLAVFLQGILGESFFFSKKMFRTSALLLAITVMLFSVFQKIIILTLLFGQTLWNSIDQFTSFIWSQFLFEQTPINFSFSVLIISLYAGVHLLTGLIIGITAGKLPQKINIISMADSAPKLFSLINDTLLPVPGKSNKKKKWWRKKSGSALIIFSVLIVVLSYLFPDFGEGKIWDVLIMLVRSVVIISLWYFVISPFILKMINKLIKKKRSVYSEEIFKMIELFPRFGAAVKHCWKNSGEQKSLKRLNVFLTLVFAVVLLTDISGNE